MDIPAFCAWLENSAWATAIHQSLWLFPMVETAHLFGIILLVGATSALDLRLIGLTMKEEPVSRIAGRLLPWAWAGLTIQVMTGICLFASEATRCWENKAFRIKMVLLDRAVVWPRCRGGVDRTPLGCRWGAVEGPII